MGYEILVFVPSYVSSAPFLFSGGDPAKHHKIEAQGAEILVDSLSRGRIKRHIPMMISVSGVLISNIP